MVTGDSKSVHAALSRLYAVVQEYPYSDNVEEAIFFTAVGQSALPSSEQTTSNKKGALDFLEYLGEGYIQAEEGAPTAMLETRWDFDVADSTDTRASKPTRDTGVVDKDMAIAVRKELFIGQVWGGGAYPRRQALAPCPLSKKNVKLTPLVVLDWSHHFRRVFYSIP